MLVKLIGKRWDVWIMILIGLITILIGLITLYYTIDQAELSIFYDLENVRDNFTVYNLGKAPANNVKISYTLDCQEINYNLTHIPYEAPILTGANGPRSAYTYNLDNRTREILDNYIKNKNKCEKKVEVSTFIPFSEPLEENDTSESLQQRDFGYTPLSKIYCDKCVFKITATSEEDSVTQELEFTNPAELNMAISCALRKEEYFCAMKVWTFGPNIIQLNSDNDPYKLEYAEGGVNFTFNKISTQPV